MYNWAQPRRLERAVYSSGEMSVEIDRNRNYAVISGDIIGSSKLSPSERAELPNILKQASNKLHTFWHNRFP